MCGEGIRLGWCEVAKTDLDILATIDFYSIISNPEAKFVQFCLPATTVLPLDGNQPAAPTFPVLPFPTLPRPPDLTSSIPALAVSPNCRTPNLPSFPTTPDRNTPVDLYRKMRLCLTATT